MLENKSSLVKIIDNDKELKWEDAIKIGVDLLVKADIATEKLADAIIESTNKLGPYYVLMPKVALAHTSPGDYNKKTGLSLVCFKNIVKFSQNDRYDVNFLFTLSAIDGNSHMEILKNMANLLADDSVLKEAINAENEEELYEIFKGVL